MRVYLASSYTRKEELQGYAAQLKSAGFEVTSRWLREKHGAHVQQHELTRRFNRETSQKDLIDINRSDLFVIFTRPEKERGGMFVEMGWALHMGLPVVIVGLRVNVFCYLPRLKQFDTFEELLNDLSR